MPSFELLLAFVAATAVFAYMPGPATLYTTAQTIARGQRAGWLAALGIHVGGYVHVLAAAFGLALLFAAVPTLYLALKLAGAAYLIWLGLKMLRAAAIAEIQLTDPPPRTQRRAFWDSAVVEILNPKTALFYLAFLPQFTDPGASLPLWSQLLILGTVVNVMFSSADVLCVVLATQVRRWVQRSAAGVRVVQRIGGAILIGLGVRLALSRS